MENKSSIIWFVMAAVLMSGAFLVPETVPSLIFGWGGVFLLVHAVRSSKSVLKGMFIAGLIMHAVGFYWLVYTISVFGGFAYWLAAAVFALFCGVSALQQLLCGYLYLKLRSTAVRPAAFALSWFALDMVFPQMFPWRTAHTQVVWTTFAGIAEFTGVTLLSGIMIFWAESIYEIVRAAASRRRLLRSDICAAALAVCFLALLGASAYRTSYFEAALREAHKVRVALVQGNLGLEVKANAAYLEANIRTYRKLTKEAAAAGAELVIWPESVMNVWTPESASRFTGEEIDPYPGFELPLLYGTLSFRERPREEYQRILDALGPAASTQLKRELAYMKFNSVFAASGGEISGYYHKQVLMPFGEYLPFARRFPALRALSPQTGDLDFGDQLKPIAMQVSGKQVEAMPLICYEDLVPRLSRSGSISGAELLVNLTNDAWYGRTHAPYEHHLLALWRAVENRRFLVRSTNTGYTAVVDPLGRTVSGLPIFSEGFLLTEAALLNGRTLYMTAGDVPAWVLLGLSLCIAVIFRRENDLLQ